jgi:chemosensory pili system protein ChpA (sensor histidine kinase/response regulator)
VVEIKRALHTLKGSARTAGAHPIGSVAHHLETFFTDDPLRIPASLHTRLGVGFDELHQMVGDLQRGRELDAAPALAAIDAAAAQAAPAVAAFVAPEPPPVFQPEPPAAPEPLPEIVLETPASWEQAPVLPPEAVHLSFDEPVIELAAPEPVPAEPIVFAPAPPPVEPPPEEAPLALPEVEETEAPSPFEFTPTPAAPPAHEVPAWQQVAPAAPIVSSAHATAAGVDDEITDIFSAEATELLEQLDTGFEGWQNGDDTEPVGEVLRALHTLKGGARMAGLNTMGDAVHELETRVNALLASGEFPDTSAFAALRAEMDRLQVMHDQIRRGQAGLLVSAQGAAAASQEAVAPAAPAAPVAAPAAALPLTQWAPELFWKPAASP